MNLKRILTKGIWILFNPATTTNCRLDSTAKICSGTQIKDSSMGRYSYCGHNCFILKAEIGSFVSIADNCRIGGANHPIKRVSTSPVFHSGKNIFKKNYASFGDIPDQPINIHSDVWVGANAIILPGVTVGVGAVIGAGSVVTHDIPPYEIWGGNPAKKIRNRFDADIIEKLLETEWWRFDEKKLIHYAELFDDPERFISEYARVDVKK